MKLLKVFAYGIEGTRKIVGISVDHGLETTQSIFDKLFQSYLGQILLAYEVVMDIGSSDSQGRGNGPEMELLVSTTLELING